jgi:protein phosphatase PTC1
MSCFGCLGAKEDPADYEAHNVKHDFFEVGLSHDMNPAHRRTMEDAHVVKVPYMNDPTAGFFAVFDGHGGKEAAEEAASQLHVVLEAEIMAKKPMKACFENAYAKVDEGLKPIASDRGSTAVTCMIRKEGMVPKIYAANAGDARAVLCRNGRAVRLTEDHKPSDEKEKKRITDSGGFITNDRVNSILGVSRALGDHMLKKWVISTPYYIESPLQEGDSMLIIACDGVWDVIQDSEAIDIARGAKKN